MTPEERNTVIEALENGRRVRNFEGGTKYQPDLEDAALAIMRRERELVAWVVESGEYEQRGVYGVYSSLQESVNAIKRRCGPPYIVTWRDPKKSSFGEDYELAGHFTGVPRHSGSGPRDWTITPYNIDKD